MKTTYLALEIRRTFRSTRFVLFAVALPVLIFLLDAGIFVKGNDPQHNQIVGVLMVNMMAFGALSGAMSSGAKLAFERSVGWQRQLRLTSLKGSGYMGAKAISGMLVALPALIAVPLLGAFLEHVQLSAGSWAHIILGIWLGGIPFVLLGLLLGQFGTPESMQPMTMLVTMLMGFLGGLWIPIDTMPGWLQNLSPILPSYWLTQMGRGMITNDLSVSFGKAAGVLAIWAVVLGVLVIRRYRKDSARA
jgi:ABC-2 type transport system permease protein